MEKRVKINLELQEVVKEYFKVKDEEEDMLKMEKNLLEERFMLEKKAEALKGLFSIY